MNVFNMTKELDHLYQGKPEMDWYDCDGCKCRKYCSWHEERGC